MSITSLDTNKCHPTTRAIRRLNRRRGKRPNEPTSHQGLFLTPKRFPRKRNITRIPTNGSRFVRGERRLQRNLRPHGILSLNGGTSLPNPNLFRHLTRNTSILNPPRRKRRRPNGTTNSHRLRILRIYLHRHKKNCHRPQHHGTFTTLRDTTPRRNALRNHTINSNGLRGRPTIIRRRILTQPNHLRRHYQTKGAPLPRPRTLPQFRRGKLNRYTSTRLQPLRISRRLKSTRNISRIRPIFINQGKPIKGIRTSTHRTDFRRTLRNLQLNANKTSNTVGFRGVAQFHFFLLWRKAKRLGDNTMRFIPTRAI